MLRISCNTFAELYDCLTCYRRESLFLYIEKPFSQGLIEMQEEFVGLLSIMLFMRNASTDSNFRTARLCQPYPLAPEVGSALLHGAARHFRIAAEA